MAASMCNVRKYSGSIYMYSFPSNVVFESTLPVMINLAPELTDVSLLHLLRALHSICLRSIRRISMAVWGKLIEDCSFFPWSCLLRGQPIVKLVGSIYTGFYIAKNKRCFNYIRTRLANLCAYYWVGSRSSIKFDLLELLDIETMCLEYFHEDLSTRLFNTRT